ncbi:hypothetical protein ACFSQ7_39795 [Paenibacillus rhizoplanae]
MGAGEKQAVPVSCVSKEEVMQKLDLVTNKLLKLGRPDNEAELQNLGEDAERRGYFCQGLRDGRVGLAAGSGAVWPAKSLTGISVTAVMRNIPSRGWPGSLRRDFPAGILIRLRRCCR